MTRQTTERDRHRIRVLFFEGKHTKAEIVRNTGFTMHQVRKAIDSEQIKARSGRPILLSKEEEQILIEFIQKSTKNRRMTYFELSQYLFDKKYGEYAIRSALRRNGYKRYVALRKPPLSAKNIALRLKFAEEHLHWTPEDWEKILWTDETWVTYGRHRKTYVTRKPGEELDAYCINEKEQRKSGWMFWGGFSGAGKGPTVFWEKEWGKISAETYQQRVIPLIEGWFRFLEKEQHPKRPLFLMQDNAPGHYAESTQEELDARRIARLKWPPFSPDLNPIEKCWNWMKDYISYHYGDEAKPSYNKLRGWVQEAWDMLPDNFLQKQLASMHERMEAVIAAKGGHTKF